MLAVSGRLNREAGGPSVIVPIEPELVKLIYNPAQWAVDAGSRAVRPAEHLSVPKAQYAAAVHGSLRFAGSLLSCARREQSTHAPQALELLNGDFSNRHGAGAGGARRARSRARPAKQVDLAFRLALGRVRRSANGRRCAAVSEDAAAERVGAGGVQPERFPVREMNDGTHISEHPQSTRVPDRRLLRLRRPGVRRHAAGARAR